MAVNVKINIDQIKNIVNIIIIASLRINLKRILNKYNN